MAVVIKLMIKPAANPITIPMRIKIAADISLAISNLNLLSLETTAVLIVRQLYSLPMALATRIIASTPPKEDSMYMANGRADGSPNTFEISPSRPAFLAADS